jgi:hypothetical protein
MANDDELKKLQKNVDDLSELVKVLSSAIDKVSRSQTTLSDAVTSLLDVDELLEAEESLSEIRNLMYAHLPGDSTTDAPPPDVKKKK